MFSNSSFAGTIYSCQIVKFSDMCDILRLVDDNIREFGFKGNKAFLRGTDLNYGMNKDVQNHGLLGEPLLLAKLE